MKYRESPRIIRHSCRSRALKSTVQSGSETWDGMPVEFNNNENNCGCSLKSSRSTFPYLSICQLEWCEGTQSRACCSARVPFALRDRRLLIFLCQIEITSSFQEPKLVVEIPEKSGGELPEAPRARRISKRLATSHEIKRDNELSDLGFFEEAASPGILI